MDAGLSPAMSEDGRLRSDAFAVKFGKNLRAWRDRAALSQEELAALASLHRTEVGMLENGIRLARVDTMVKLAGALKIPPEALLRGIEWVPIPTERSEGAFRIIEGAPNERAIP